MSDPRCRRCNDPESLHATYRCVAAACSCPGYAPPLSPPSTSHPLVDAFANVTRHLINKSVLDEEAASYAQEAYLGAVRDWLYEIPGEIKDATRKVSDEVQLP